MFIYQDCQGELYTTKVERTTRQRKCKICGDYDHLLGEANNVKEAWVVLYPYTNRFDENVCLTCPNLDDEPIFGEICQDCDMFQSQLGYDYEYIDDFIYHYFGKS